MASISLPRTCGDEPLTRLNTPHHRLRLPRTCGDEPLASDGSRSTTESAPHLRG